MNGEINLKYDDRVKMGLHLDCIWNWVLSGFEKKFINHQFVYMMANDLFVINLLPPVMPYDNTDIGQQRPDWQHQAIT